MIKYFVRTTLDRQFNYDLPYEQLVDLKHDAVHSYIDQLRKINDYDSVLLEDDLILCSDFKNKIEEVISQYPNNIINFFEGPNEWCTSHFKQNFMFSQCVYYPKGVTQKLADLIEKYSKIYPSLQTDQLQAIAMRELGINHYVYKPNLVQHLDTNTLIQNKNLVCLRRSIYFIDYLNELGIDYMEANSTENISKLYNLMYAKFKNLGKS